VFASFDTKNVTTRRTLQIFPPPDYFLFPKLNRKLKGLHFADDAEIQEAVSDDLKKAQKEELSAAFTETVRPHKSLYIQSVSRL